MVKKTEINLGWHWYGLLMLLRVLKRVGIGTRLNQENGNHSVSVFLDDQDDEALMRLCDVLAELRVRYIETKQAEKAEQMSFLEGQR